MDTITSGNAIGVMNFTGFKEGLESSFKALLLDAKKSIGSGKMIEFFANNTPHGDCGYPADISLGWVSSEEMQQRKATGFNLDQSFSREDEVLFLGTVKI